MPLCEYKNCRLPFEPEPNVRYQRFCKRPECVAARKRDLQRVKNASYRDRVKLAAKADADKRVKKKCSQPLCNHKTDNRFGICNHCRGVIMAGMDMNYFYAAE